jgi:hypothetical protein
MWRLMGTIQPTHLTNIFGEEKFSRLPSKNKVADEMNFRTESCPKGQIFINPN